MKRPHIPNLRRFSELNSDDRWALGLFGGTFLLSAVMLPLSGTDLSNWLFGSREDDLMWLQIILPVHFLILLVASSVALCYILLPSKDTPHDF